ncbi:MAG: hypothetical protein KDB60_13185 [Propionibacteriaceae bacterium]|nr:hypothetical protein [Propionibacteriaceae bacterium]
MGSRMVAIGLALVGLVQLAAGFVAAFAARLTYVVPGPNGLIERSMVFTPYVLAAVAWTAAALASAGVAWRVLRSERGLMTIVLVVVDVLAVAVALVMFAQSTPAF